MLEWLRNHFPPQGSSTERWSRNTLRVLSAIVFYVIREFLTSPFVLNNSVERRQSHLTWSSTHDVVSREINLWKSFDFLRGSNLWPLAPSVCHSWRNFNNIVALGSGIILCSQVVYMLLYWLYRLQVNRMRWSDVSIQELPVSVYLQNGGAHKALKVD